MGPEIPSFQFCCARLAHGIIVMSVSIKATLSPPTSSGRPNDPELLTREEAAAYLRVSVSSLAHWSTSGLGPVFVRLGRRAWYRQSVLDTWIESQVPERMRGR